MSTTRLLVTDTETTGDGPEDQVIEISVRGRVLDREGRVLSEWRWHRLIRPTCPVSAEARAAHHLTDEELRGAPTMEQLLLREPELGGLRSLREGGEDDRVLVAHYAEFDRRLLTQSHPDLRLPTREICTYRCAMSRWPDAPRFSNQVLRYWLGVEVPRDVGPPHRAQHDTLVTSGILDLLLTSSSVEELIRITSNPILLKWCRIGEQAGRLWSDVDEGFLRWLLAKGPRRPNPKGVGRDVGFSEDERHTARFWRDVREKERRDAYEKARADRLKREAVLPLSSSRGEQTVETAGDGDD